MTVSVYAQGVDTTDDGVDTTTNISTASLTNPLAFDSITEFLDALVQVLLIFAVPIIVLYIIYAGFLFVTAQGNEQKLSDAKRALMYALIGGAIVIGAAAISNIIVASLNPFCEGGSCVDTTP